MQITVVEVFKLLSDTSRLRIINLLYQQKRMCVCELEYVLNLSQPNLSKHLANMKKLGIVDDSKKNKFTYYSINKGFLSQFPFVEEVLENEVRQLEICCKDLNGLTKYVTSDLCCDTVVIKNKTKNKGEI